MNLHRKPDAPIALQLPFDFHRLPGTARRLQSHSFALSNGAPEAGTDTNSSELGTPGRLLAAAFGMLLARYGGQRTLHLELSCMSPCGAPQATRRLGLEIGSAATCRDVLRQTPDLSCVSSAALDLTPLCVDEPIAGRAAVSWFEARGAAGRAEPDTLVSSENAQADLTLMIGPDCESRAAFVYDSNLFKPSSIERFASHLGLLVSNLSLNPGALVSELPLLLPAEQRWLESVCDGGVRAESTELVHELVALQARAMPQAVALRFRDRSLSYGELNRRANQLAHYLLDHGIGLGCHVVVCVEPGFEIVEVLLGILKAGAVYVPLDPTYPSARMRAILEDTKPKLIVTQDHLKTRLEFECEPAMLVLDALPTSTDAATLEDLHVSIDPEQTAYIFYTSGTTGSPKGVMASHANLAHYILSAQEQYQIDSRDIMPSIARFSFSISMFELLAPLVAGGTLIVLEREHILDPARMSRTLAEVTIFHAGPSLLKGLVRYIRHHYRSFAAFSRVRHASSGGDMVPPELLEALKEIFSNAEVFVIYGCSEISCMGCTYPVPRDRNVTTTYVGRPFGNVLVRVLDDALNVLPAGVVGEIHFAGGGVTRGYLNRAELTAEKFVTIGGRRFYRTGDRGRLSEDGWLEILGRSDFQIKLRGMRVELGEVEHQLRRAPGVRDAVATTKEAKDQEKILIAYVVTERTNSASGAGESDKPLRIAAIRRHMADNLPDYMVPSSYVELDQLPLNHNMKVDRRALPEPTEADLRAGSETRIRAPETPSERSLMGLWQKLLGVEEIGLDDNFFELGGHSLLAMQLCVEVEKTLGAQLEGMDILRESLEVLAAICDQRPATPRVGTRERASAPKVGSPVEIFHFGDGGDLYGVLHGSGRSATNAVLICGPVGQEHARTRFVLTRLAKQLARRGVPTLMFDYFGCGDSLGESRDAPAGRWQTDIAQAYADLQRRANGARVTAVGVRLGALLLCDAATRLDFARLVLWDPVCDGAQHGRELAAMQRAYLRSVAHLRFWNLRRARPRAKEFLGTTYSEAALRDLNALALTPLLTEQRTPIRRLITSRSRTATDEAPTEPGCRVESIAFDCGWQDVARLEDVIPDVHISSTLASMITEEA